MWVKPGASTVDVLAACEESDWGCFIMRLRTRALAVLVTLVLTGAAMPAAVARSRPDKPASAPFATTDAAVFLKAAAGILSDTSDAQALQRLVTDAAGATGINRAALGAEVEQRSLEVGGASAWRVAAKALSSRDALDLSIVYPGDTQMAKLGADLQQLVSTPEAQRLSSQLNVAAFAPPSADVGRCLAAIAQMLLGIGEIIAGVQLIVSTCSKGFIVTEFPCYLGALALISQGADTFVKGYNNFDQYCKNGVWTDVYLALFGLPPADKYVPGSDEKRKGILNYGNCWILFTSGSSVTCTPPSP